MTVQSKLKILTLRTQRGKTFTCIHQIQDILEVDISSIHVVMTQNTYMNQAQFLGRIDPAICISFGSKAIGARYHAKNVNELFGVLSRPNSKISVVVCCSNIIRLRDIQEIFRDMHTNLLSGNRQRQTYIYFDEVHEIINMCEPFMKEFAKFPFVQQMTAITATPENIAREFNISISKDILEKLDANKIISDDHYYKLVKHNKIINPSFLNESTIQYTVRVLKMYFDDFFKPFARNFVPSQVATISHMQMKDEIFKISKKATVIVINTEVKSLFYYDDDDQLVEQKVDLFPKQKKGNRKEKTEFKFNMSVIIADTLRIHRLSARPLFITGHECISVGVTFCGMEFGSFTNSVIYFPNMQVDDLYQFAGRTTGNIMDLPNFQETTIFTTHEIYSRLIKQERDSYELERKSYEEKINHLPVEKNEQQPEIRVEVIQVEHPEITVQPIQVEEPEIFPKITVEPVGIEHSEITVEPIQDAQDLEKQTHSNEFTELQSRYKSKKRKVIESDSDSDSQSENDQDDQEKSKTAQPTKQKRLVDYSDSEESNISTTLLNTLQQALNEYIEISESESHSDSETNSDSEYVCDSESETESDLEYVCDSESESEEEENQVKEINGMLYIIFKQELDSLEFMRQKCQGQVFRKARKYPGTRASPIPKRYYGNSVTELNGLTCLEIVLKRWGLDSRNRYRKIYSTVDDKYVVYWKK